MATAGFPTHKRLVETIEAGEEPPLDLKHAALFHMGSMNREVDGKLVPDFVNPTTSTRFNAFIPSIVRHFGVTALAGKGGLDLECVQAMKEVGCVYLSMTGGAAPLLTGGIEHVIETGWDDLIMQFRLTRFSIKDFGPLTVSIDAHGNSTYDQLSKAAYAKLPELMQELNDTRPDPSEFKSPANK